MQRLSRLALCAFALELACGETTGSTSGSTGESTDGGTTTSTGTTDDTPTGTSTATTASESSTSTSTGEPLTTGGEPTTLGTTTEAATTSTETTGDTETTGTPAEPLTRAWWVDGNTLQLRILQQDSSAGLCRGLILEALASGGVDTPAYEPVDQPAEWAVRYVFVHDAPDDCFDPYTWYENEPASAAAATGTITLHDADADGQPETLDLEVTGTYVPSAPWTPAEDLLAAAGVVVEIG